MEEPPVNTAALGRLRSLALAQGLGDVLVAIEGALHRMQAEIGQMRLQQNEDAARSEQLAALAARLEASVRAKDELLEAREDELSELRVSILEIEIREKELLKELKIREAREAELRVAVDQGSAEPPAPPPVEEPARGVSLEPALRTELAALPLAFGPPAPDPLSHAPPADLPSVPSSPLAPAQAALSRRLSLEEGLMPRTPEPPTPSPRL
eukprot:scaffold27748_cov112-Isochrysis_galbana.AAC.5